MAKSERIYQKKLETEALYAFDYNATSKEKVIVGVDEVGRGPLAGPVVAAAVILDRDKPINGINDSKKLSGKQREKLYSLIIDKAHSWAIGIVPSEVIDRINILQATFEAMKKAIDSISFHWDTILVDGNKMIPQLPDDCQKSVVGGDRQSASIAAASIVAKVTRDRMMFDYHTEYPRYHFDVHKGYGTLLHRECIQRYGLCPIHRKSFCIKLVQQITLAL